MKSVALHNLGCKVNAYEIDVMQQMLQEKGYHIVPFDEMADIYIINTCTVTNIADRKSRQMLHQAKKRNPDAIVVAVGCYVQTDEESVKKDPAIDLAIGNNRKKDIATILDDFLQLRESDRKEMTMCAIPDIAHEKDYEEVCLKKTGERTRAYIKIQDGCNQFCSYCMIPYARGRVRSRDMANIVDEIQNLALNGYKEFVLTGIHVSSYGTDETHDIMTNKLADLLEQINELSGVERIRLSSLEPRVVTEEFASRISKLDKICPHFHLSLQSGCDATLKRMNRHYTTWEYLEKVELLRKYFNCPAITTDIIVGFPGETQEEFETTYEFAKRVHFYEMHIFKYSKRKGTVAATMKDQVPDTMKAERSDRMLELEAILSKEYREGYISTERPILFEEPKRIDGDWYQIGHTPEYIKVAKKSEEILTNKIQLETLKGFLKDDLILL